VLHVLPTHVRPTSTKAAVMYDRADAALVAGDRVQARSYLETAAASAPDDPVAQAALAEVLDGLGYAERAVEASRRAMRSPDRVPDEARAYVTAIDAVVRDDATATTLLERLVVLAPAEPSYRVRLATALVQAGKPLDATRTLALARIPPLDAALLDAAIAQASGDTTAAFAHATRALTPAPPSTRPTEHARALVLAAAARWRLDDTAGAYGDYERALQLGDTGVQLAARDQLMQLDTTSADVLTAAERVRAQASLIRSLGDRAYLAELLMDGSSLFAEIGHIDEAEAMVVEARQHATALANAVSVARIDVVEARLARWRGQLARARSLAERAYREGIELARSGIRGNSFYTWSHVLLELDDATELARARALRTEKVERLIDCITSHREGDLDRADRIAHALANLDTREGRVALTVIAQVAMVRGRLDAADAVLAQVASHMGRDASSIVAREQLEHAQAELLAKRGHLTEALTQLDRYAADCATGGLGTCEARTLAVAARLALAGASADAPIRAARAIARAEQLEMHRTAREVRAATAPAEHAALLESRGTRPSEAQER
jgi:tetratricopeptide (TPR) repeat protein